MSLAKRSLIRAALVAVHVLVLSPVAAQSPGSGALEGVVRDSLDLPLEGVVLTLESERTGFRWTAQTPSDGRFRFPLLPPGEYALRLEAFGFVPRVVVDLPIQAGERLSAPVRLRASAGAEVVDTSRYAHALLAGAQSGVQQWVWALDGGALPEQRRELTGLARLSSTSNERLETEGLPGHLTGLSADGLAGMVPGSSAARGARRAAMFPLSAIEGARLISTAPDIEWAGYGGGILSADTRSGGRTVQVDAFGSWSRLAPENLAAGPDRYHGHQGGVSVSGPILRDTASFAAGIESWSLEAPLAGLSPTDSVTARFARIARETFGVGLEDLEGAGRSETSAVAAFGRLDWQVSPRHLFTARANVAALPSAELFGGAGPRSAYGSHLEGREYSAATILRSRLGERLWQEFRIGVDGTYGEPGSADGAWTANGSDLPGTRIPAAPLAVGTDANLPSHYGQQTIQASQALHYWRGAHHLKVGISVERSSYEESWRGDHAGEFLFAGLDEFARATGAFVQTVGPSFATEFAVPRFAAFAQEIWTPTAGLDLILGVRYDSERLPTDDVALNERWLAQSGLDNTHGPTTLTRLSPRVGFVWSTLDESAWVVQGMGGIYSGAVDRQAISEWLSFDGRLGVRRGLGSLAAWPLAPSPDVAPVIGPALTLLAPGVKLPRTARASLGVSRAFGSRTALHLSGTWRRSEFLPRRRDLNLAISPVTEDQHGRPIYGLLRQQGGLLAPESGSNRRFPDFERVSAVNADGSSEYLGLTIALERRSAERLNLLASYTFSRTEDNGLFGGYPGSDAQLPPFPDSVGSDEWLEGRSDLDIPHRMVVGAELALPAGAWLGALYRYESGRPFTPGFREGVDANGDGSAANDPAFVDGTLPGMEPLLQEWGCLRAEVGGFAARNSCRGRDVHSLDLRLGIRAVRLGQYALELVADGLNLLGAVPGHPDTALYLIDGDRELVTDPATGTVSVPLQVNGSFGEPRFDFGGRMLRLGLRVNF